MYGTDARDSEALKRTILAVAAGFLLIGSSPYPAHQGQPVIDAAEIIPDSIENDLNRRLTDFETKNNNTFVVATVPSLNGEEMSIYRTEYFRYLSVGHKGSDNGVLLVVAPNERKVGIATGYGIEDDLTDIESGRIIQNVIIPRFKEGDMVGGIVDGTDAILEEITPIPPEVLKLRQEQERKRTEERAALRAKFLSFFGISLLVLSPFIIFGIFWYRRTTRIQREIEAEEEAKAQAERERIWEEQRAKIAAEAEARREKERLRKLAEQRARKEMLAKMTPEERAEFLRKEAEERRKKKEEEAKKAAAEARRRAEEAQRRRTAEAARRRAEESRSSSSSWGGGWDSGGSSSGGSSFGGFDGGSSGGGGADGSW